MKVVLKNEDYFIGKEIKVTAVDEKIYSFKLLKANELYQLHFYKFYEQKLIDSKLLDYKLIRGYEAIYSSSNKVIEGQLSLSYSDYKFLCYKLDKYYPFSDDNGEKINNDAPEFIEIPNNWGINISIGECSNAFRQLLISKGLLKSNDKKLITIKINNIDVNDHQDALTKLQEYAVSTFFSISTELQISIILKIDTPARPLFRFFLEYDEESALKAGNQLKKLKNNYEIETVLFYLNANRSYELPFYQFLQYYHCLEYYFRIYQGNRFKKAILSKISSEKTNTIEPILEKLFNKNKGFTSEIECLKDVLTSCLNSDEIKNYINSRKKLKKYYIDSNEFNTISNKEIKIQSSISLDKIALRIYDIRNSIVHSKFGESKIEVNEDNIKYLKLDIKLLKFIVEIVIISNKK